MRRQILLEQEKYVENGYGDSLSVINDNTETGSLKYILAENTDEEFWKAGAPKNLDFKRATH